MRDGGFEIQAVFLARHFLSRQQALQSPSFNSGLFWTRLIDAQMAVLQLRNTRTEIPSSRKTSTVMAQTNAITRETNVPQGLQTQAQSLRDIDGVHSLVEGLGRDEEVELKSGKERYAADSISLRKHHQRLSTHRRQGQATEDVAAALPSHDSNIDLVEVVRAPSTRSV